MTLKNNPSEASFMVNRQLKSDSQVDAFTISATGNNQFVFKKLACLIVFVKDVFDIYLNNIYHMNFNATKCPFGHFGDSVGKQCKSWKIM